MTLNPEGGEWSQVVGFMGGLPKGSVKSLHSPPPVKKEPGRLQDFFGSGKLVKRQRSV